MNMIDWCEICKDYVDKTYIIPLRARSYILFGYDLVGSDITAACAYCIAYALNERKAHEGRKGTCYWCGEEDKIVNLRKRTGLSPRSHLCHDECKEEMRKHPNEYRRIHNQNNRTAKRGLPSTLTLSEWVKILRKYKFRCAYCGGVFQEIDHIIPVIDGGGTTKDNVCPSCTVCNRNKPLDFVMDKAKAA